MRYVVWRKLSAWFVPIPAQKEHFERAWNFIDRIFKLAQWLVVIGVFSAFAQKLPSGSRERWTLTAIYVGLAFALCAAALLPYLALLYSRLPDPKGLTVLNRLKTLPIVLVAIAIWLLIIQAVQFALLAILSVEKLP